MGDSIKPTSKYNGSLEKGALFLQALGVPPDSAGRTPRTDPTVGGGVIFRIFTAQDSRQREEWQSYFTSMSRHAFAVLPNLH